MDMRALIVVTRMVAEAHKLVVGSGLTMAHLCRGAVKTPIVLVAVVAVDTTAAVRVLPVAAVVVAAMLHQPAALVQCIQSGTIIITMGMFI